MLNAYKYRGLLNYERVTALREGDEYAQLAIKDLEKYHEYFNQDLDICDKLAELHSMVGNKEGAEYFRYCSDKIRAGLG